MMYCKKHLSDTHYLMTSFDHDSSNLKPPRLKGCTPDAFLDTENLTLIGEAKTSRDYYTEHSMQQYEFYFDYLRNKKNPLIIFSSDWRTVKSLKSIVMTLLDIKNIKLNSNQIVFIKGK